ncbi:MAG: hydrogenase maturation protease [Kiritimatiellae bacterium]|nr:hydrogenase maturation protease [Kiritimatiellia bacterium]
MSVPPLPRVLVIGYGNPGRLDDGLGPALAEALERERLPAVDVDCDYQLTVEHAADVAQHGAVVFVDADAVGPNPFSFRRVAAPDEPRLGFSSHSVRPEDVMALARSLFHSPAAGYLLGIRGYAFDAFGERLSAAARRNLGEALRFLVDGLRAGDLSKLDSESIKRGARPRRAGATGG